MSIPVRSRIASTSRLSPPRRGQIDLPLVARLGGGVRDQALAARGDVLVVGVRLVPLEHRELGVVGAVDALVAEVLAELVHALEPADDQPFQVELGRDPQEELAIERVVVRRERPGERAPVERLQHRCLDLDEPLGVEEPADRGDHARAGDEQLARLLVGDQVELALAKARLDVGQAVVLLGRRPQRLGQQREVEHPSASARPGARRTRSRRPRSGRPDPAPGAAPSPRRRARRRAPGAGSARSGPRDRGTPSSPGRAAPRAGPRRGGGRPSHPRAPAPRAQRGRPRSARPRRTRAGTGRSRRRAGTRACAGASPAARRRRRLGRSRPRRAELRGRDVDLGDLEVPFAPGRRDDDLVAALAPEQGLADRRLVRELRLGAGWPRPTRRSCTSSTCRRRP